MMLRRSLLAAALLCAVASRARAQDPDLIRGRVTGPDSLPIENASITITPLSGDLVKTARSDKNGNFSVTFLDAYGDYWVSVQSIGYSARRFEIKRIADEDVLVADVRLSRTVQMLQPMTVQGRRPTASRSDGMTDITGSERYINSMGIDASLMGDLAALAGTMPGVTYIPSAGGVPGGFSVFGLDADQNSFLLNGMSLMGGSLPRDAGVSASLNTNPYDAGRGGFSGGLVSGRLGSGSNYIVRTMSATGKPTQLQWVDPAARAQGQLSNTLSVGGRMSGPISMNRSFYNVSAQFDRSSADLRTLLNTDPAGLQAIGIVGDSVTRFKSALDSVHVPFTAAGFPGSNVTQSGSVAGTLTWTPMSAQSSSYDVTFAGNGSRNLPSGFNPYDAPAHAGTSMNYGGSMQLHHSKYFKSVIFANTWASVGYRASDGDPYLLMPSASVRVNSQFPDGSSGVRTLQFGGNASMGSSRIDRELNLRNELSWVSMDNKHRLRYTTELRQTDNVADQSSNLLGSFSFNSLKDLEDGHPASFSRLLTPRRTESGQTLLGLALNDSWRVNPDLQMTLGIRADAGRFTNQPAYNAVLDTVFGVRNDQVPNPVTLSPRFSFSKNFGQAPQISFAEGSFRGPRQRVSGGLVVAQSFSNASLVTRAANSTGLPSSIQTLTCSGAAAPTPDWDAYRINPNNVPTACAPGTEASSFASGLPQATVIDKHYSPSRRISANLGWSGMFLDNRFSASVNGSYSLNLNQEGWIDLNFDPTTRFVLASEGNRPVFVNPSSIFEKTGAIAVRDARKSQRFSRVTEYNSNLRSDSKQMTVSLSPYQLTATSYSYSLSYTLSSQRRMVQGFQSTVGNPLDTEWGTNDINALHAFSLNLSWNPRNIVRISWGISLRSGAPITPRVAGDINGDGASNDRAYIFDPATTADTALANAMRTLIETGSPIARDCLSHHLGQLAPLGTCHGPWTISGTNSLNLIVNPLKIRMPQRASLRFQLGNPMGALDMLFHGASNIHGWGQQSAPDQTLLYVRGFDSTTKSFKYEVNQRFGSTRPQQSIVNRSPVTITALLQLDLGPTRERQQLTQSLDRGRKTEGTMMSEASFRSQYISSSGINMPNPMIQMLRQAEQLKLTPEQTDSLASLNREYVVHLDSIWTPVAKYFGSLPKEYDQGAAYGRYKSAREASVDLLISFAPQILGMLTSEQKRLLPASMLNSLDVKYLKSIRSSSANSSAMMGMY